MKTIERRILEAERLLPMFDFSSLSDAELHAAIIEEMASTQPEHAVALRRAGERVATGTAWPVILTCRDIEDEYAETMAALLAIGHE